MQKAERRISREFVAGRTFASRRAMSLKAPCAALLVFVATGCGATSHDRDNSGSDGGASSTGHDGTASGSDGGSGGTTEGVGGAAGGNGEAGWAGTGAVASTGATGPLNSCELALPPAPSDEASSWVLALDGLATRWAEATCAYYSRCQYGFGNDNSFWDAPGGCVTYFERDIANLRVAMLVAGLESGRAFYDEEAMDACLEAVTTDACGEVDPLCADAAGGLVPLGGACGSSFDCEGEASCKVTNECPGVCVPVDDREPTQDEGMPCDDAACLPGLICLREQLLIEPIPNQPTERNTCVVPAEANELCPNTTSGSTYPCADEGYQCVQDEAGSLRCLPPLDEGEACYYFGPPCEDGLMCVEAGDGSSACRQFVYAGLDEPCSPDIECVPGTTCATVTLELNVGESRCVAEASPGGTCYSVADNCPPGEHCVRPKPPEEASQLTGTCEPRKPHGEACETDEECEPFTWCTCGVCEALAQIGEGCRHDSACWSHQCIGGICASPSQCP